MSGTDLKGKAGGEMHHGFNSFCEPDPTMRNEVLIPNVGRMEINVVKGDFDALPLGVQQFIAEHYRLCKPKAICLVDGSEEEAHDIIEKLVDRGMLMRLMNARHSDDVHVPCSNCYLCRTDPADVARVEGKTYIITPDKYSTVPHVKEGCKGILGQWLDPEVAGKELKDRFDGCMQGRVMYVIPYSMGPIGSPLSKIGVELTDFNYVVLSMRIMTRVSLKVFDVLGDGEFVKCVHSIGAPRPLQRKLINHWPCNPERVIITHFPDERKIMSFGSGYGGNSLLGKKCFALRIASRMAKDEGWLAEHMLIMSVTNPQGVEKFVAAAFPSACGKTNMAMLSPTIPGWKVRVVGDDIAWMRFDDKGVLRGINPEAGFFGVAPGTNFDTNPMAMETCEAGNTIYTNVGMTDEGEAYWEGMDDVPKGTHVTSWTGEDVEVGKAPKKIAHPNSRFCCPASQCPIIHPKWEDPEGVPIDALIFGGRRPEGVPLVYETNSWQHGVMVGASVKSEATAAAEFKGKQIMHDPMAMRPFMGYNFGQYLQHWLDLEKPERKMPKIFHVNWFRVNADGKFVWPGFGENIRVVDWICRRCDGEDIATDTAIGKIPKPGTLNTDGIKVDWDEIFTLPKEYFQEDIAETMNFLDEQVGCDLPAVIKKELEEQKVRIDNM